MGNFLQKPPPAPSAPAPAHALASTPLEELADSAHEQCMSAHTMQSTLRLLIVGQAPIEPWKLVGEPPRGVSRATSLRSLTSMRLTPRAHRVVEIKLRVLRRGRDSSSRNGATSRACSTQVPRGVAAIVALQRRG